MSRPTPWLSATATVAVAVVFVTVTPARADEPAAATPLNYVVAAVGTTLAYQPNTGSASGWQHDLSPVVGFGRYVTATIALELDLGPTYIRGTYTGFALVPAAVWNFSTHVYAAARFLVPVDPKLNFALFPGVGVGNTFDNGITVFAELNASSTIGRGDPDLGLALTGGALYSF
jgi:hypothetical protein